MKYLLYMICVCILVACTSTGFHRISERQKYNFGRSIDLNLWVFKEKSIRKKTILELVNSWREELALYNIKVKLSKVTTWQRPGFFSEEIYQNLLEIPLFQPCDRMLVLVDPRMSDFIWELFAPVTVLGAVDGYTHSRGYIMAKYYSLNQFFGASPKATLIHEGYHLLGCGHAFFLTSCYKQIHQLKLLYNTNMKLGNTFFPALREDGFSFLTRKEINSYIHNRTRYRD